MTSLLVAFAFAQIHPARFPNGTVVSDSSIASEVGASILRKGGNAVDAAVATGFALAVTFPAAGNLGGGGFMLVRMANGQTVAIDYREVAPRRATKDMYKNPADSLSGYLASGVPGTPMGMWEAHRKFGKLPWKDLVEPSVRLARDGFVVSHGLAGELKAFKPRNPDKGYSELFALKDFQAGEILRQPDLAKTLERIKTLGAKGFYEGETAKLIDQAMRANGGLIDTLDLKNYKLVVRTPLQGEYRGYQVLTMPPPSSGGIALLQMLTMLKDDDLTKTGFQSSATLHLAAEAMKRAFADRSMHLGDPDFVSVPTGQLLNPDYLKTRRASITDRATPSSEIKGMNPDSGGMHTTHYSVVDREGNAVANTYTLNTGYGSKVIIPGTGVLMNNEMDDFTTQPGKPNVFGLIQSEKNIVEPGKRPLSSMTPTILVRDGKVAFVIGSPGGPTIINTVFQTILNVVDFRMNIQLAVAAPRFHHQWMPDEIKWEPYGLSTDVRLALEARGHELSAGSRMGSCHCIQVDASGVKLAGVDPRVSSSGAAGW
ncbi:MAG: gamma-glutamyltransferase [Chlorobia bacterium]|nr:gamma-glutamyltransferase [Fimbriimonadaceae bacterium]